MAENPVVGTIIRNSVTAVRFTYDPASSVADASGHASDKHWKTSLEGSCLQIVMNLAQWNVAVRYHNHKMKINFLFLDFPLPFSF
jgi:hypothetical protein